MLGNVWEWCEDRYGKDTYRKNRKADKPKNPLYQIRENGVDYRVIRGGSWLTVGGDARPPVRAAFFAASPTRGNLSDRYGEPLGRGDLELGTLSDVGARRVSSPRGILARLRDAVRLGKASAARRVILHG